MSALGYAGLIPLMPLIFIRPKVLKILPEIWRVATAFLITGPKLSILLDPFFLFRYGSELETGSARFTQPGDFFTYLVFCGLVIVVSSLSTGISKDHFHLSLYSCPPCFTRLS